jgi:aspartyl-tRNA(Asn)/glutamyl-tRNA(Gln) amidotransferase subunit A
MDSTSLTAPAPDVVGAARSGDVKGLRIGLVTELGGEGYAPGVELRVREAIATLQACGAEVVEVSCPHFIHALATYYLIMPAEVSSNLARYDGMRYGLRVGDDGINSTEMVMRLSRGKGFGAEAKRRIILGTYALSAGYYDAFYGSAQKMRTLIARDFAAAFEKCDVLVSPATPTTAFKLGEHIDDPLAMYVSDLCTIPANLAGIAAAAFPCGLAPEDGLPVGFQVMAPALADDRLYLVGAALERELSAKWGGALLEKAPLLPNTKVVR